MCHTHTHTPAWLLSTHPTLPLHTPPQQTSITTNHSTPQALLEALLQYTDAGVATSADAVVTFDEVAVLAPRGRYQVEMHASFLKLVGQVRFFVIFAVNISHVICGWKVGLC